MAAKIGIAGCFQRESNKICIQCSDVIKKPDKARYQQALYPTQSKKSFFCKFKYEPGLLLRFQDAKKLYLYVKIKGRIRISGRNIVNGVCTVRLQASLCCLSYANYMRTE